MQMKNELCTEVVSVNLTPFTSTSTETRVERKSQFNHQSRLSDCTALIPTVIIFMSSRPDAEPSVQHPHPSTGVPMLLLLSGTCTACTHVAIVINVLPQKYDYLIDSNHNQEVSYELTAECNLHTQELRTEELHTHTHTQALRERLTCLFCMLKVKASLHTVAERLDKLWNWR